MDEQKEPTVAVSARIPESMHKALLRVCRSERRTLSQLIRIIFQDWLKDKAERKTDD